MKPISKVLAAVFLLVMSFLLVWMNRFQYEHTGTTQVLVRINRITGQQCFLTSDRGWDSQLVAQHTPGDKWDQYRADAPKPTDPYPGKVVKIDPNTGKPYLADDPTKDAALDNLMYSGNTGNNGCR
jgi:hypothetical protein